MKVLQISCCHATLKVRISCFVFRRSSINLGSIINYSYLFFLNSNYLLQQSQILSLTFSSKLRMLCYYHLSISEILSEP